jgi:hypothetical protein
LAWEPVPKLTKKIMAKRNHIQLLPNGFGPLNWNRFR